MSPVAELEADAIAMLMVRRLLPRRRTTEPLSSAMTYGAAGVLVSALEPGSLPIQVCRMQIASPGSKSSQVSL